MIKRRKTKQIEIGGVKIGGNAPITVQSMCNTDTRDVKATVNQIKRLQEKGCELIRVAILNQDAAQAVKEIKKLIKIPLIADIHFDYRLAITVIENGIDALRINPGNIGNKEHTKKVVDLARTNGIPIRIGVNAGSLQKDLIDADIPLHEKLVKSALKHIEILEENNFYNTKVSLKSSDVQTTIEAYRLMSKTCDYPLHLGVTEAGTFNSGLIKSSVGMGTLLAEGIGDTIRVSLTDEPEKEVWAGYEILKSLGLRQRGVNFISCPTCGRTQINLIELAKKVQKICEDIDEPLTIAVMGCAVNGPGEARHADLGIAGGIKEGYIFSKGEILKKVPEENLLKEFKEILTNFKK